METQTHASPRSRRARVVGAAAKPEPVPAPDPYRVLVLTPTGRDGALLREALAESGLGAIVCQDMPELCRLFRKGAGAVIVAEEALTNEAARELQRAMREEPFWSDLPLVILTGSRSRAGLFTIEQLGALGNVTVLARPVQRALLVRTIQVALRARERQYERRQAAETLQTSLREKEVMLREIHHRVKNNLQIISSLLSLQADAFEDPAIAGHFQESQERIHSMALVHEKLYGTSDLSSIDMRGYVESLAAHLTRSYALTSKVDIDIDVDPLAFEIDLAIPCGLILNELISNALKYAFPNGQPGQLRVWLKDHPGGTINLGVKDDGIGLPEHVDPSTARSLGLRLVDALVRQVAGTLTVERALGTRFTVVFPSAGRTVTGSQQAGPPGA